jgi:hypothetical protein
MKFLKRNLAISEEIKEVMIEENKAHRPGSVSNQLQRFRKSLGGRCHLSRTANEPNSSEPRSTRTQLMILRVESSELYASLPS